MFCSRPLFRNAALAAAFLGVVCTGSTALAQRDAGSKINSQYGSGFYSNLQSGERRVQHATDYSRGLQDYSHYATPATPVAPLVAREHADEIKRNIDAAQKNYAELRKALSSNKEAVAYLDAIDKHLASSLAIHTKLHAECLKESIDTGVTMACCKDITAELEKAAGEHKKLLQILTGEKPVAINEAIGK